MPAPVSFPLAVVTGLTNLKATITVDQLTALAGSQRLLLPCGVTIAQPPLAPANACVAADAIAAALRTDPKLVALLPPGLVEPATKVLPIAGDGPFGLFGPDLFGDPAARACLPDPGARHGRRALDPAWTAYDAVAGLDPDRDRQPVRGSGAARTRRSSSARAGTGLRRRHGEL